MIDLKDIKTVAVGSTNPVKVEAVRVVIAGYVDHEFEVVSFAAPHGITEMPLTREETKT